MIPHKLKFVLILTIGILLSNFAYAQDPQFNNLDIQRFSFDMERFPMMQNLLQPPGGDVVPTGGPLIRANLTPVKNPSKFAMIFIKSASPEDPNEPPLISESTAFCKSTGFSNAYMESFAGALNEKLALKEGAIFISGELGFSDIECLVPVKNMKQPYLISGSGPFKDWTASDTYPNEIEVSNNVILSSSGILKAMTGKGVPAELDLSLSSLAGISLSNLPDANIYTLPDNKGIVINNIFSHEIEVDEAKLASLPEVPGAHKIFVKVTPFCSSWTARGGGGDKCPPPKMPVKELELATNSDEVLSVWDPRYVYNLKVIQAEGTSVNESDIIVVGLDSALFGRGGCNCDINAKTPSVSAFAFWFIIGTLIFGVVLLRKRSLYCHSHKDGNLHVTKTCNKH